MHYTDPFQAADPDAHALVGISWSELDTAAASAACSVRTAMRLKPTKQAIGARQSLYDEIIGYLSRENSPLPAFRKFLWCIGA